MTDTTTLAELAVAHPAAARVFYANHLDFCCGGRRPFADACRERGLDAGAILEEIRHAEAAGEPPTRWELAPMPALVDHIVNHYHRRLRASLPHLVNMARLVEVRHHDKVMCPLGLSALLEHVQQSVLDHLEKEETILFPPSSRPTGAISRRRCTSWSWSTGTTRATCSASAPSRTTSRRRPRPAPPGARSTSACSSSNRS